MKKSLLVLLTVLATTSVYAAETKEVCKDVLDKKGAVVKNKDGSSKQACKTIKVHKKFEGTEVPTKK
jgi:hypothetical protein